VEASGSGNLVDSDLQLSLCAADRGKLASNQRRSQPPMKVTFIVRNAENAPNPVINFAALVVPPYEAIRVTTACL
jgi:hypothetical protein